MIKSVFGFLGGNKIIVITLLALLGLLAGSGLLLKQSYKANGKQSAEIEQWQHANQAWSESWQNQQKELEAAQQRMIEREITYQSIQGQLNDYQEKLWQLQKTSADVNCISDAEWLLIENSANHPTAERLSSD